MIKKWRHCCKVDNPSVQIPLLYFILSEQTVKSATEEILLMLQALRKNVVERDREFCMLVNTEEMGRPEASIVMRIVEFMKEVKPIVSLRMKGSVIVIQNSFIRGLVNLCFSLQTPTTPVHVVSGMDKVGEYFTITDPL